MRVSGSGCFQVFTWTHRDGGYRGRHDVRVGLEGRWEVTATLGCTVCVRRCEMKYSDVCGRVVVETEDAKHGDDIWLVEAGTDGYGTLRTLQGFGNGGCKIRRRCMEISWRMAWWQFVARTLWREEWRANCPDRIVRDIGGVAPRHALVCRLQARILCFKGVFSGEV